MKLLFDQNLSFKLVSHLADLFPGSAQVRQLNLDRSNDEAIWQYAKLHEFLLVTQDSDFADLAALYGPPPKVIWLRCGNQPTRMIDALLRRQSDTIAAFAHDKNADCLEIF